MFFFIKWGAANRILKSFLFLKYVWFPKSSCKAFQMANRESKLSWASWEVSADKRLLWHFVYCSDPSSLGDIKTVILPSASLFVSLEQQLHAFMLKVQTLSILLLLWPCFSRCIIIFFDGMDVASNLESLASPIILGIHFLEVHCIFVIFVSNLYDKSTPWLKSSELIILFSSMLLFPIWRTWDKTAIKKYI